MKGDEFVSENLLHVSDKHTRYFAFATHNTDLLIKMNFFRHVYRRKSKVEMKLNLELAEY